MVELLMDGKTKGLLSCLYTSKLSSPSQCTFSEEEKTFYYFFYSCSTENPTLSKRRLIKKINV